MKISLFAIGLAAALSAPIAHAEPSAHRLYMLCEMEDPACATELAGAYVRAIAAYKGQHAICTNGHKLTGLQILTTFLQHAEAEPELLGRSATWFEAYVLSSALPCYPGARE